MMNYFHGLNLDVEAISGIFGSISIACWVVVFSPQIIENFRRSSTDGLSIVFIIVWLLGDVFNIIGAVAQGVLPTMIILAVYYTFADLVLLAQCFYYRGFTLSDAPLNKTKQDEALEEEEEDTDDSPLLNRDVVPVGYSAIDADYSSRRGSGASFSDHVYAVDGTHLSPATPLLPPPSDPAAQTLPPRKKHSTTYALLFNTAALLIVCAAGVLGWWLSTQSPHHSRGRHHHGRNRADSRYWFSSSHKELEPIEDLHFDIIGQIFGYLCAVFYLGSRVPQLLLNYRRKSTEGVSMLFFLFACVGNLTYVLSIFAYDPVCGGVSRTEIGAMRTSHEHICVDGEWSRVYWRYIMVNLSWLVGSAGTLALDGAIFGQFWVYRERNLAEDGEGGRS